MFEATQLSANNKNAINVSDLSENIAKMLQNDGTNQHGIFSKLFFFLNKKNTISKFIISINASLKIAVQIHTINQKELNVGSGLIVLVIAASRCIAKQIFNDVKRICKAFYFDGGNLNQQLTINCIDGIDLIVCTASSLKDLINIRSETSVNSGMYSSNPNSNSRRKKSISLSLNNTSANASHLSLGKSSYSQTSQSFKNKSNFNYSKKKSAPVNMPKVAGGNRYRRVSTDSTGSISTNSFASSLGNSLNFDVPVIKKNITSSLGYLKKNNHSNVLGKRIVT
jgi:hypothetical protein